MDCTVFVCPRKVRISCPLAASQTFTVWSKLPEARRFPSGLHDTTQIMPPWLGSVRITCPLVTSQTLMVLSRLSEARNFPSGLHVTEVTKLVCSLRVRYT